MRGNRAPENACVFGKEEQTWSDEQSPLADFAISGKICDERGRIGDDVARPIKTGVDFFPLDVHMDDSIELIEAEFGLEGFAIVVKLWQKIYAERGYYCEWNDEVALLFAKKIGAGGNVVSEIVNAAIRRGIFNDELFNRYGILTSFGIQTRYFEITSRRTKVDVDKRYLLVSVPENGVSVTKTGVSVYRNRSLCIQKSHKVKESKVKENKTYKRGADKSTTAQEQVVISLIQNDGNMYGVTDRQIARWAELYPAVDIMQELRRMCGWLEANPTRRKTSRGIPRFINTWLSKAQDKGGGKTYNNNSAAAPLKRVNAYGETEDEFFERLKNEGADLSGFDQGNTV